MGGHIDCYIDCVSLYSYIAMLYLLKNRDILATHDITVDFHPIFLGGVNVGSGNKPPWTLPAKAKYGQFDAARAKNYHGMPDIRTPEFFPILSLLPQRALTHVKATHPSPTYEKIFLTLFSALWIPPQIDTSIPANLLTVLNQTFPPTTSASILEAASLPDAKAALNATTKKILDQGAFGAPWMWVRNNKGEEEPFFGSDRFHFMWEFLGLSWKDIELLPANEGDADKTKAKL